MAAETILIKKLKNVAIKSSFIDGPKSNYSQTLYFRCGTRIFNPWCLAAPEKSVAALSGTRKCQRDQSAIFGHGWLENAIYIS
ncbi:hypothetical protein CEXT_562111 [Caerostris extrusa]|uniref:Uncharacterized protein n=1 Tax=Caerostris extrusa TaxID=172846 RepID=A0AAV4TLY2_CAEEX|nr:hypothetical protein CEXT_562111 [Caerostris extrusa]